jgi:hypothetical protein
VNYYGQDIAVDTSGNSYVTGYKYDDFAGDGSVTYYYVFIAKYDTFGNQLWIKQFSSTGYNSAMGFYYDVNYYGQDIAVDTSGNSYVTGYKYDDFAGDGSVTYYYVFIAKYDTSGNQLWMKSYGPYSNFGKGIAVDANGNSYVTGYTHNDLAGTGNAGRYDVFIMKHDTSGEQLWIKQFGSTGLDYGNDIAVSANGNSYVTGIISGDLPGIGTAGGADVFIAHLYP